LKSVQNEGHKNAKRTGFAGFAIVFLQGRVIFSKKNTTRRERTRREESQKLSKEDDSEREHSEISEKDSTRTTALTLPSA